MAIELYVKGFYDDYGKFKALLPVWSEYSKYHKLKPINYVKLSGLIIRHDHFNNVHEVWHPDNYDTDEKWIQVRLHFGTWGFNDYGEYVLKTANDLNFIIKPTNQPFVYYYMKAEDLRKVLNDISYASKDREAEENKMYEQGYAAMNSNAIANSYY